MSWIFMIPNKKNFVTSKYLDRISNIELLTLNLKWPIVRWEQAINNLVKHHYSYDIKP